MITTQTLYDLQMKLYDSPFSSDAIIAGGSVRDIDHGKVPKDIDIFCLTLDEDDTQTMKTWIVNSGLFTLVREYEMKEFYGDPEAQAIQEVDKFTYQDNSVDFVFCSYDKIVGEGPAEDHGNLKIKRLLSTFDLGICQAALKWDNENNKVKILKTDHYKQDKQEKVITNNKLLRELTTAKRQKTIDRTRRIGSKLQYRVQLEFGPGEIENHNSDYRPRQVDPLRIPGYPPVIPLNGGPRIGERFDIVRNPANLRNEIYQGGQLVGYVDPRRGIFYDNNVFRNDPWRL